MRTNSSRLDTESVEVKRSRWIIYSLAILASLVLTALTIYHYPVINSDGLEYLRAAECVSKHEWHQAMQIRNWPFYYILIAYTHDFTGLSFLNSAYFLNYLFSALIIISFLWVVEIGFKSVCTNGRHKCCFYNRNFAIWAAVVILVFHSFNHYRAEIIRDHGYWLFLLLSLGSLLNFARKFAWRWSFVWFFSAAIAMLFRIEGAVLLLLSPLIILFLSEKKWTEKSIGCIKLYTGLILSGIVAIGLIIFWHHDILHAEQMQRLFAQSQAGWVSIYQIFISRLGILKMHLLPGFGWHDAAYFLFFGMLGAYGANIFQVLSLGYTIVCIYAVVVAGGSIWPRQSSEFLHKRDLPLAQAFYKIIFGYIFLNLFISAFFYAQALFVSSRYVFPVALSALPLVPLGLMEMHENWKRRDKSSIKFFLFPVVIVCMLMMLISSVYPFGYSKVYLYQAAKFLKTHTENNAVICTNNEGIAYLSERRSMRIENNKTKTKNNNNLIKACDYIAIVVSAKSPLKLRVNRQLVRTFWESKHHRDRVEIYRGKGR